MTPASFPRPIGMTTKPDRHITRPARAATGLRNVRVVRPPMPPRYLTTTGAIILASFALALVAIGAAVASVVFLSIG